MPSPPHARLNFRAPWYLFWAAFGLRVAAILIGHTYRINPVGHNFDFGFEAGRIAQSLVTGHGYGNPFNGPSGPTAWLPPLYPLLVALAFRLFGVYTHAAALFLMVCDSAFSAAIAPAVYEIAARCFDAHHLGLRTSTRRASTHAAPVALWSGWLWAVYPAALQYAVHWIWEMSLTTFLFSWTFVLALRLRRTGEPDANAPPNLRRDLKLWAIFGLLWGLVALSNASVLLCLPAVMLWIGWPQLTQAAHRSQLRRTFAGALLTCAIFLATQAPWVIRNERAMHALILTRSNFGVELWQSSRFWHDVFPWGQAIPPWQGSPEFKLYARMGEVAYSKMRGRQAIANLRAHPATLARFTVERIQFFWFGVPHPSQPHPINEFGRILNFSFTSLAGLLGLALALRRRVPAAWLLALPFLLVPLPYYLVTVQARFRHPIEPFITILAVFLFRSTTPRHQHPSPGA